MEDINFKVLGQKGNAAKPRKTYAYLEYGHGLDIPKVDKRKADERIEFPLLSFVAHVADMYSYPSMIELNFPSCGKQQRFENAKRIRSYFTKALGAF